MPTLPKLKQAGLLTASATAERPTKHTSDFDIAWVTGLKFRNSDTTAAVCVTPRKKDPRYAGLHLTVDAARALAVEIRAAAELRAGAVSVFNHSGGKPQTWARFADADARVLADRLAGVSGGN